MAGGWRRGRIGVDPDRTCGGGWGGLEAGDGRRARWAETAATARQNGSDLGTSPWKVCRDLETAAAGLTAASKSDGVEGRRSSSGQGRRAARR